MGTFSMRPVTTRSCGYSPLCLRLATSSCMSLRCSTRFPATSYVVSSSVLYPPCFVSPWVGLFSCHGPLASHLHSRDCFTCVSVPRAHGSLTVCSVALWEIKEAMRTWLGITSLHFLSTVSGWITLDTTVMDTLGHMYMLLVS